MSKERNYDKTFLILGLNNSGKSLIKNKILSLPGPIYPTTNFEIHKFETNIIKSKKNIIIDCSGDPFYRENWKLFIKNSNYIIYVIDSSDRRRININKECIKKIFDEIEKKYSEDFFFIFFLFNKNDLKNSLDFEVLKKIYNLEKFSEHNQNIKISIKSISAIDKEFNLKEEIFIPMLQDFNFMKIKY